MNESMHRSHDPDLISALVEGSLADPTEALGLVESCPECAQIYRSHVLVRQAVAEAGPAEMTDLERRRIRMAVWDELESDRKPVPTTPWWYRIAPVAAALVVVVGVGGVIMTGGGGGDSSSATTAAADLAAGADGAQDAGEAGDASLLQAPAATSAPDDTVAADEEQAFASETTSAAATESAAGGGSLEMTERTARFADRYLAGETSIDEEFGCWEAAESEGDVLAAEADEFEGSPVWVVAFGTGDEVEVVVVYDRIDCTVVFRDE